jgi:hypothetical protein
MFFKIGPKGWFKETILSEFAPTIPFIDQMGLTFL